MDTDSDTAPDPVFSSAADKMPTKIFFFPKLYAYYFLKVHLQQASKIKRQKVVKNSLNQSFSYFFILAC
jgi:hypothetical protein